MATLENLITECKFRLSLSWSVKMDRDLSLKPTNHKSSRSLLLLGWPFHGTGARRWTTTALLQVTSSHQWGTVQYLSNVYTKLVTAQFYCVSLI